MTTSSLLLLAFLFSFAFMSVTAAPNRATQDLIGPENFDSEMISSATTCQTAILRCCTPDTPTTNATWSRCFEKNSCGGLFVVHDKNDTDRNNIALGACAFLSQVKELVDEEDNTESTDVSFEEDNTDSTDSTDVSVRNEGNPFAEEQDDLANTHTDKSSQSDSSESNEDPSKNKIIFTIQQNPTNRIPFASEGCHGGSHEKCIEDKVEGGCGTLEQINLEAYVKCVKHCVEHCKSPGGR